MTRRLCITVVALYGFCGSVVHTDAQQSSVRVDAGAIHGLVVDDQRQPIERAVIGLASADTGWKRTAISGADGTFDVEEVPITGVTLVAARPGFVTMAYGARRIGQPGPVVRLTAGERKALTLVLDRTAAIAGVVRDGQGEPIVDLRVSAQAATPDHNRAAVYRGGAAVTNGRGEYRISGLPPGAYIVMAARSRDEIHQVDARGVDHVSSYLDTYFPAATRSDEATPVTVEAGATANGVNFSIPLLPSTQVTGEIQAPNGEELAMASVTLVREGQEGRGGQQISLQSRDPRFLFRGITQGRYTVSARAGLRVPPGVSSGVSRDQFVWGAQSIDVDGSRPMAVTLTLERGFSMTGRIEFESAQGDFQRRGIVLRPVNGPFMDIASFIDGSIGADGRFTIQDVPKGTYTLSLQGPNPDVWSARSVVVEGVDALDTPFELTQDVAGIVVTMTSRQTAIEGTVVGRDGQPSADVPIIVYSADRLYWTVHSRRVRAVPPDTRGRFTVRGLPEGSYLVAAADIDVADGVEPTALERLRAVSVPVTLKLGETAGVSITIR